MYDQIHAWYCLIQASSHWYESATLIGQSWYKLVQRWYAVTIHHRPEHNHLIHIRYQMVSHLYHNVSHYITLYHTVAHNGTRTSPQGGRVPGSRQCFSPVIFLIMCWTLLRVGVSLVLWVAHHFLVGVREGVSVYHMHISSVSDVYQCVSLCIIYVSTSYRICIFPYQRSVSQPPWYTVIRTDTNDTTPSILRHLIFWGLISSSVSRVYHAVSRSYRTGFR